MGPSVPSIVDLFAGAGGLGLGLAAAGFLPKASYENDETCCRTLIENNAVIYGSSFDCDILQGDLRHVQLSSYCGKVDLLSGGPPCQPFSKGGLHQADEDNRDMFPTAVRAVKEMRPKAFIFENVAGIVRPRFRDYYEYVRLQLSHPEIEKLVGEDWLSHRRRLEDHHSSGSVSGLNYRLIVQTINAADYGIPQLRNRVFFVGFREDLGIHWHFPSPTHSCQALFRDMKNGIYWERNEVAKKQRQIPISLVGEFDRADCELAAWKTTREAIRDLPSPLMRAQSHVTDFSQHEFRAGAKSYKGHTGSRLDEPAKTLKAGVHGVPGGENMLEQENGTVRYFTIRECARLQTFPDSYRFAGPWSRVVSQLGNAVPFDLARQLGSDIRQSLGYGK